MLIYVLLGLSLMLAALTGLQFFYMVILERRDSEQKFRIHELERRCIYLSGRLTDTEGKLSEQNEFIEAIYEELETEDDGEVWAEIIEDR